MAIQVETACTVQAGTAPKSACSCGVEMTHKTVRLIYPRNQGKPDVATLYAATLPFTERLFTFLCE